MFNDFKNEYDSYSYFLYNIEKEIKVDSGKFVKIADFIAQRQADMQDKLVEFNEAPMASIYDQFFSETNEEVVKKPKIIQLRRKTDKKMRSFTQTMGTILKLAPFVNELLNQLDKCKLGPLFSENLRFYLAYENYQMRVSDSSKEGFKRHNIII